MAKFISVTVDSRIEREGNHRKVGPSGNQDSGYNQATSEGNYEKFIHRRSKENLGRLLCFGSNAKSADGKDSGFTTFQENASDGG